MSESDVRITQPSYTGGEMSDEVHGRKDLAKTQVGLRRLENCFVHAYGGVSNRSGLRLVSEVKDSTKTTRLMPFEAAEDDAYALEVGDLYIRPIFHGAYIDNLGSPYEIVTPYPDTDVSKLYADQSNDVATIVHPSHAIAELSRVTSTNWPLSVVSFQPTIAAPTGETATATYVFTPPGTTGNDQPIQYEYQIAAVGAGGEESLPSGIAIAGDNILGYAKNFNVITWTAVAGATEYVVYKAKNGLFGFIGRTPNLTFTDDNISPLFADGPQQGANPFSGANKYPSLVAFAQQRRVFAATLENPQTIWMTQSGNFKNLGTSSPAKDDDAVEFTLAANRKQDIFHMVTLEKGLIVFTRSGVWRVRGRDGEIITPSSILPEPQTTISPSNAVKPIIAGEQIVFPTKDGRSVYDLEYSLEKDRLQASDLTLLAKHLFRDRTVVAWSYSERPYGMFWLVMSDGALLSLTYLKQHDVWGWGRHSTKGKFIDVVSVPEDGRDVPYFIVRRRIGGVWKQFVEFMEDREFVGIENAFFVDCGLSLDNPVDVTAVACGAVTTLTAAGHGLADGDELRVYGLSLFDDDDGLTKTLDGRYFVTNVAGDDFEIQSSFDEGDTLNDVDTADFTGDYYDGGGVIRKCFQDITGLDHLEGRKVVALADGNVIDELVVTAGQVSLDRKYALVHVGLSYVSTVQTLDLLNLQGDDIGKTKSAPLLFIRVRETRGIRIGLTEDDAYETEPRQFEDYGEPPALKTELLDFPQWTDWDKEGGIFCIQEYPLPMTLLGTTTEQNYGG